MLHRNFYLRHADDAVMGIQSAPGDRGTFDPTLARVTGSSDLSRVNLRPGGSGLPRRRGRGRGNRFRMGAMTGQFSTTSLIAVAVVGVAAYLIIKKK